MHDLAVFGAAILLVSVALLAALLSTKLSGRFSIPAAAAFLVVAAFASDLFPSLDISIRVVERVATVALIVILFDGGASIGWRRFRAAVGPIASLGVVGTFATAGGVALFGHWAFGLGWIAAGLLGAAVAPTDPAVMFSVFGGHEVEGRAGTILEGESGANDPVGIALMIGMIELATHSNATFWIVVREFSIQMAVGLLVGALGGLAMGALRRRLTLPSSGLYALECSRAPGSSTASPRSPTAPASSRSSWRASSRAMCVGRSRPRSRSSRTRSPRWQRSSCSSGWASRLRSRGSVSPVGERGFS